MAFDIIDQLLQEVAESLDIEKLELDNHNTCLIAFPDGLEVNLEPSETDDTMLIVVDLRHIPPGRFREDVFKQALIANTLPAPRYGTFSYSEQSDHLIYFGKLPLKDLNGERIVSFLLPFIERARAWKSHLEGGNVPIADTIHGGNTAIRPQSGIFGLRP